MSVTVMVVFVRCRDYPLLFETFNMPTAKASLKLKSSTATLLRRGTSPRVSAVLQSLKSDEWTQSSLAEKAGINRGVLNQLWNGRTSSSPMLVGRLCAVLPQDDATRLLAAYLDEVLDQVAAQESSAPSGSAKLRTKLSVVYPPRSTTAAA